MTTITSIGIGNMGAALATALLNASPNAQTAGNTLTIWNRTPNRPQVTALITAGAHFEPSLPAAIARSSILLLCLFDYDAITAAFSASLPLAGKTIINLTNGTPNEARAMEAYMKRLGAAGYFDGGIMVTPQLVGTPASFVILSSGSGSSESGSQQQQQQQQQQQPGEAVVFETEIAPVLKPIGAIQYVSSTDAGAASLYDVAALAAMYGMFMGAFTGIALLKRGLRRSTVQGDDEDRKGDGNEKLAAAKPATDAVTVPLLAALVPYVSLLAAGADKEDWLEDDMGNPLAMQAAGMRNILRSCEEEGVDGSGMRFISELMDRAVGEGLGAGAVTAISKYLFK
ncbi:come operon protein 4 [Dichotomopilus funicola]|uniref:Come operon protein 4 n=1 Tax=Dichotomopilus funicola TaxID=1934379 RepID=A0AAN6UXS2_9PEZI|nr:come operon protein 4 [Dichotomopilus funicola]